LAQANTRQEPGQGFYDRLPPDAFTRSDDSDDARFYGRDRFVSHLDSTALATVERLIGRLVIEERPAILDLMAGWDSHLPPELKPGRVVGLGLNAHELERNRALGEAILHDLNQEPRLPFPERSFDAVLITVSVDYLTRPLEVFREAGRVLKPGGLFLVIFSNRMFPQKAVKIWKESSETERLILVEDLFKSSGAFEPPRVFISKGKPRPAGDKYAGLGLPSDPIYAVYADRAGAGPGRRPRPAPEPEAERPPDPEAIRRRKARIRETLACPYCGRRLSKWAVPQTPFTSWDNEYLYVCFNDECDFVIRGFEAMNRQGNIGFSCRLAYDPIRDRCRSLPVPSLRALKEGVID